MKIIEINADEWTEREGLSSTGKRVKAWYVRNSDNKSFLYKLPKKYSNYITSEIWTEIIAYQVGISLNLEIPKIYPARNNNEYGVLVENFLEKGESLSEAQAFLSYSGQIRSHNILFIEKFLTNVFDKKLWYKFKQMLVYDCIIGNNDRHSGNWGLCYQQTDKLLVQNVRFAPIYDNASCLTRELPEQRVKDMLDNVEKFNKYITGKYSKPTGLYWNQDNNPKLKNHFELILKLIDKEPDTK